MNYGLVENGQFIYQLKIQFGGIDGRFKIYSKKFLKRI